MTKISLIKRVVMSVVVTLFVMNVAFAQQIVVTGKVLCDGKGVAGVVVSDGVNVVVTNKKGAYTIKSDASLSKFVHISVPSGYEVECKGSLPQFYGRLDKEATKQSFDFNLREVDQSKYTIITVADTHVSGPLNMRSSHRDRERFTTLLIPAINDYIATQKVPTYVMSCGDMTQANYRPNKKNNYVGYSLEDSMEDTKVNAPLYTTMGNHDHNNPPKGMVFDDSTIWLSRVDYNKAYGPSYYSLNIGREHFVFVDNTFVLTNESKTSYKADATSGYQVKLDAQQQAWLEKDIAALDKKMVDRVVVVAHCQTINSQGKMIMLGAKKFYDALKDYDVILFTGHAHRDNIAKATINGRSVIEFTNPCTAGTAWYTPWNVDGSPGSAVAYSFEVGNKYVDREYITYGEVKEKGYRYRVYDNVNNKWHYPITKSSGSGWSYQHDLQVSSHKDSPAIIVNIWGAYSIDFTESTGGKGVAKVNSYDLAYRDWYWDYYRRSLYNEVPAGETLRKAKWQAPATGGANVVKYIPHDPKAIITVRGRDVYGRVIVEFTAQAAE